MVFSLEWQRCWGWALSGAGHGAGVRDGAEDGTRAWAGGHLGLDRVLRCVLGRGLH